MQEIYRFNKSDFDENGFNKHNGNLIVDFIKDCEKDFHKRFKPLFANNLFANYSTMKLITNSFVLSENEFCGMDGEYDFDINLEIDTTAKIKTIFAIGSAEDEDEPLYLTKDDTMREGIFILKYIPDDDECNLPANPVEDEKINKKLVSLIKD